MRVFEALQRLFLAGFRPGAILDAGAHVGDFAIPTAYIYPDAQVLLIDPLIDVRDGLRELATQRGWAFAPVAVGAAEREWVAFNIADRWSSLLPNFDGEPYGKHDAIQVTTLDALVQKYALTAPYLLKMDIQGAEIEALKGAAGMLPLTPVIVAEVNFVRSQRGTPLFHEVVTWLGARGYRLYDLMDEGRRSDETLRQFNAVFVQDAAGFIDEHWQTGERVAWS